LSPQSRSLLVIVLLGAAAVVALGWIAGRYSALIDEREERSPAATEAAADRRTAEETVEAFIRVRAELRRAIDPDGAGPPDQADDTVLAALLELRAGALEAAGMDRDEYLRVRKVYHDWRQRALRAGEPLALPLERRRDSLNEVDLGPYEALDL
jgi:hypothetical protein